ncbi:MAG: dihydrodipicolinate synthase family protein [Anaerolineaceae bacterium]
MLENKKITGIVTPVITSFSKSGSFDEEAQRDVVRFLKDKVDGFFPTGSYGMGPLLNVNERKQIAEVVVSEVDHAKTVIIMSGATNTRDAIDLSRHAESIGADAVGAIPPYYFSYSEDELYAYYADIINAVNIPVLAYNYPKLSNNSLSPKLVKNLAKIGLAGIKDSSMSLNTFHDYLLSIPKTEFPNFYHIIGTESLGSAAVSMGAKAIISGLSNAFPEILSELWNTIQSKNMDDIRKSQLRVLQARSIMKNYPVSSMALCYEILRLRGVNCGYPRKPFLPASNEILQSIIKDFQGLGFQF